MRDEQNPEERRVDLIESITADEWYRLAAALSDFDDYNIASSDPGLVDHMRQIARLTREIEE
jgi:hypothetical protein